MIPEPGSFVLGDCMDPESGLPAFDDDSVDHVITDPPYSEYVHEIGTATKYHADRRYQRDDAAINFAAMTQAGRERFASEVVRITRGWAIIFTDIESCGAWSRAFQLAGAKRKGTHVVTGECVWTKPNAAPRFDGSGPAQAAEAMTVAWCGTGRSKWYAGGARGHYHFEVGHYERRHETEKPLPLMRQLILDFTAEGELVVDPFAGGGTTLLAAKQVEREFIGWELGASEQSREAWRLGLDALDRIRIMLPSQRKALHKRRGGAAGRRVEQTAIQTTMDFGPPPRRARSLEDFLDNLGGWS